MRSYRNRRTRRSGRNDGGMWLSFSDLMSSLLMIIILIMFYIMYQYFDMYEINMAEIARQQFDLDTANASLEEERGKLSDAEQQMLAQQIRLNAAEAELQDAEAVLAAQQQELASAQSLLTMKEDEIAAQKESLDALSLQLNEQQLQILEQQATLSAQQATLESQQATLNLQQTTLETQQATLDSQQAQIEQLVGMKPKIISSLSSALRKSDISASVDPNSGAIALEADVLFATGQHKLTAAGQATIDEFLPVYLNVLFSEEYLPYVAEIIIEGHTDSVGNYIRNLELSQQRAGAVASYVLDDGYHAITAEQRKLLREMSTANGRSFSDPVLDENGNEDKDASRRVVFKFRLTDEQMIEQLKQILEESAPDSASGIDAVIEAAE